MSHTAIPKGKIEIPAYKVEKEAALTAEKTALLIVDMQNDFVRPEGSLYVPSAAVTVEPIRTLLNAARAAGVLRIFTADTHLPNDKETALWPEHCVKGTWGWQIIDELQPQEDELVLQKPRYDAFYGTPLDHYLCRVWQIKTLIVVGTVSNICVLHTLASAEYRWLKTVVPADGISALNDFGQAMTLYQAESLYHSLIVESCAGIAFVD
ncbi:MAG: cysteine hydrolase [candidate division KSB1 bacterium]|nr:cysteine hydrolase [candidate division KSB1 bacterium]